MSVYLLFVFY